MHEVIMPKLGLTMETGVIEKWHKKEGDKVEAGEVLFEVMTDKVSLEVEAYNAGIVRKIIRAEGEEVPVTEVIAYIGSADEAIPEAKETIPAKIKISPLARNIAENGGIDISKIIGTGPGGRIVKEDVTAFAEKLKSKAGAQRATTSTAPTAPSIAVSGAAAKIKSSTPLKGMRKLIAERMVYSKQNIPHIILTSVMNVDALIALREKIKDKASAVYNTKITYTDFIIKACATVLAEQPTVNASLVNETQIVYEDVNVGLAVAIESGLIVPTIYNADKLSVFEIAKRRTELVEKAKQGKLTIEDISNATFTISNLGMLGVRTFTAIINPPQGAILMVGEAYKAPVVENDKIEIRQLMEISIAVDHRIIDGAVAAVYLKRLKEVVENPELLLI
jgi:pyruvate dehydrogenase E2 component (dihydrolipoamide acetyltransferase)